MKKLITILFLLLITVNTVISQNLVPNPSFEIYSQLPYTYTQLDFAVPWFAPMGGGGSSDYFHSLGINTTYWGEPRNGMAYAGITLFTSPNNQYREFIEVKLTEPLIKSTKYCVIFYVSLVDLAKYAISNYSAYFSPDTLKQNSSFTLDSIFALKPQIHITNYIISDTAGWTKISGEFIAKGGEQFMTIGNFDNNANTNYQLVNFGQWVAYYIYDDISVYPCDLEVYEADAGNNITICKGQSVLLGKHDLEQYMYWWSSSDSSINSTKAKFEVQPDSTTSYYLKVKDFKFEESYDTITVRVIDCKNAGVEIMIYPNPAYNEITIEFNHIITKETTFELFDIIGRKIATYSLSQNSNKTKLILNELAVGVYTYRIQDNENIIKEDKLVVIK
ncbi:MAG: T9SS type A sorting domain-containing protein [Saprospiraceae bacterium]|nr:T9SS type A sorting domain-containing protein [Saprospiraceae bacterium]